MRHARLKPSARDAWYHCYNRAVGNRNGRPFGEVDNADQLRHPMCPDFPPQTN